MSTEAVTVLASKWSALVEAHDAQAARLRQFQAPFDAWSALVGMFVPGEVSPDVQAVLDLAQAGETWLDIGAGGGRISIPLAERVGEVIAVDGSAAMVARLRGEAARRGITNVRALPAAPWPLRSVPLEVDVAFSSHVLYEVMRPVQFLEAMERSARRLCAVLLADEAGGRPPEAAWLAVHGERYARLPALGELLELLGARGIEPTVREIEIRGGPLSGLATDRLLAVMRSRLLLAEGTAKDHALREWFEAETAREGRPPSPFAFTRMALVSWAPGEAAD